MSGVFNRMINRFGNNYTVKIRKETVNEETGEVTFTYSETISVKAIIVSASGMSETWGVIGVYEDIDYLALVAPMVDEEVGTYLTPIDIGDLVLIEQVDYECTEVIPRRISNKILYYECLLRKRE